MAHLRMINLSDDNDNFMFQKCYVEVYMPTVREYGTPESYMTYHQQQSLLGDRYKIIVATEGNIPVGMLIGVQLNKDLAVVEYVVVHKEYRRKGIATALFKRFKKELEGKVQQIYFEIVDGMPVSAKCFWLNNGAGCATMHYIRPAMYDGAMEYSNRSLWYIADYTVKYADLQNFLSCYYGLMFHSSVSYKQGVLERVLRQC